LLGAAAFGKKLKSCCHVFAKSIVVRLAGRCLFVIFRVTSRNEVTMFFRSKRRGLRKYLQIVESVWEQGRSRQRVLVTLGRLDVLQERGQLDALLASGARFADKVLLLTAHRRGQVPTLRVHQLGPVLAFERLWRDSGCQEIVAELLGERRFEFAVERAIFLTVLHRLLASGSDRAADKWKIDYPVGGAEAVQLHHLYRAMAWLGEELPEDQQQGSTKLVARTTKDVIEERLFHRRRDLFTEVEIVFFDTTSLYFEGEGGATLGQHGHSKDHRPDLHQMVVGAVLDGEGRPICCELWPGNTTDVTTLIPIVDRLWRRFKIRKVCIVADRGMISQETIDDLEQQGWPYILGARMRKQNEVREQVLADPRRFRVVHQARQKSTDPAPLKVKEVWVEKRRYVVCVNEEEVEHDRAARAAIVAGLREQLRRGDKSLVGNKGYRRFLKVEGEGHFAIDEAKLEDEARFDGTWVLRTNTALPTAEVALQFKRLWMVEQWFRSCKSLLETRPIYHRCDETIRGHVFCSFLALLLRYELQTRLATEGRHFEWADVIQDLQRLQQVEVEQAGQRYLLRSDLQGTCGPVLRALGVAAPPTVQAAPNAPTPSATRAL
jgi:transposase